MLELLYEVIFGLSSGVDLAKKISYTISNGDTPSAN